jgi:hypothetical protein
MIVKNDGVNKDDRVPVNRNESEDDDLFEAPYIGIFEFIFDEVIELVDD